MQALLALGLGATTLTWWIGHTMIAVQAAAGPESPALDSRSPRPEAVRIAQRNAVVLLGAGFAALSLVLLPIGDWSAALTLAIAKPRFGQPDPMLGVDLGRLIARAPLQQLALQFAFRLVALALICCGCWYVVMRAIAWSGRRVAMTPRARRHFGYLLGAMALLYAAWCYLGPTQLAMSVDAPLEGGMANARILAFAGAAGIGLAAAILSVMWARSGRIRRLSGGWVLGAIGTVIVRLFVPPLAGQKPGPEHTGEQQRVEALLYGLHVDAEPHPADSLPPVLDLWDPPVLATWAESRGGSFLGAFPRGGSAGADWLVATIDRAAGPALEVRSIAADGTDPDGGVLERNIETIRIVEPAGVPGATGWRSTSNGVPGGGLLRRVALAWALQSPRILALDPATKIDWIGDPSDRLAQLIRPLHWRTNGLAVIAGEPWWLVSGYAVLERAPLTTRIAFNGRTISGFLPVLQGVVRARDGRVEVYADPAGGALGAAWTRAYAALVQPVMPATVAAALSYPAEWFERQIDVLRQPHWQLGGPITSDSGSSAVSTVVWDSAGAGRQMLLSGGNPDGAGTLVSAFRVAGNGVIRLTPLGPMANAAGGDFHRMMLESAALRQLRDSVRAAGDSVLVGAVRWHPGADGAIAWQPLAAEGGEAGPRLLWVSVASWRGVAGARQADVALRGALTPDSAGGGPGAIDDRALLRSARSWLLRGDSALGRGDLTAFARSWEALRGLLHDSVP